MQLFSQIAPSAPWASAWQTIGRSLDQHACDRIVACCMIACCMCTSRRMACMHIIISTWRIFHYNGSIVSLQCIVLTSTSRYRTMVRSNRQASMCMIVGFVALHYVQCCVQIANTAFRYKASCLLECTIRNFKLSNDHAHAHNACLIVGIVCISINAVLAVKSIDDSSPWWFVAKGKMLTNQNMDWFLLLCRSNVGANQCITSMTHQLLVWLFQSRMHVQINHLQICIVHATMHLIIALTLSTHFWCIIVFGAIYHESCTCSHQVTYNFKHMKQHWWNHSCMFSASNLIFVAKCMKSFWFDCLW